MSNFSKMKQLLCVTSSLFIFKGVNRIKNTIKEPQSIKQISNQVLTFGVILGTVWMLGRTWFRRLSRLKKVLVLGCIGLFLLSILFGLIPSIVIVLKTIITILAFLTTGLKLLSTFLGG